MDKNGVITAVDAGTATVEVRALYSKNLVKTINVSVKYAYENGIISSADSCINTGLCERGTKLNVQVNNDMSYNFYVITDTESEMLLIMDRNLVDKIAWMSRTDYEKFGGTNTSGYGSDKGPITALNALEDKTNDWTNITEYDYTLSDDATYEPQYEIIRKNVRARMLTETEASNLLGCGANENSCPVWLYTNTDDNYWTPMAEGYWLSTSVGSSSAAAVNVGGDIGTGYGVNIETSLGVRPVIKISK